MLELSLSSIIHYTSTRSSILPSNRVLEYTVTASCSKPSIPTGSVNEDQLLLERKGQNGSIYFIFR